MPKILLVDDDEDQNTAISICLVKENFLVESACTADDALNLLSVSQYDVVVLDWNLPGMTGIEILQWYRKRAATPVIMLTGKGNLDDKTDGFDSGADDYLVKPFMMKELLARIRALLRRPAQFRSNDLKAGGFVLDPSLFTATNETITVRLAPREFAVLEFLARHPNEIFKADDLLKRVWRSDTETTTESLRTAIKNVRSKLNNESIIDTIPRVGYKLGG